MKKTRPYQTLIIASILFNGTVAMAQEKPDTIPQLKNEIGVNVIPYAFLMANSGDSEQSLLAHVFYKRQLKEHLYARLSLALNNGAVNNNFNTLSSIKTQSNTNAYLESNSYEGSNYLQYMAGLEGRWGKKNIRQFAGMDLSYAHYKSETQSLSRTIVSSSGIVSDSTIAHYKHTTNTIGAHPFYGVVLGFSKHFFMTAQVGINLQFTSRSSEKITDNRNLPYAQGNITTFDMDMAGIANHISVCYRF